ncbi:MAG: HAMP domain-containing histidine kinase [Clostridia bacterium]|nr:HAMP domain-containing histidine kinase [Clostridia bacterium]
MKRISGISKRWFFGTFCVIAGIILVFAVSAVFLIFNYYYNYVEMTLDSRASDLVNSYFSQYIGSNDETFVSGAINFVEDFSDKDIMEVWVIDRNGKPIVSSSGFDIDSESVMPDYELAKNSDTDKGKWTGRLSTGEKVMAITAMIPNVKGEYAGAVRYICSLEDVESTLLFITLFIFLIAAIVLLLVLASGRFFIRSIVRPVLQVNATAEKIAKGDLTARVNTGGMHDEIDQLCVTFNNMADELSQTESLKNDFISTISHELRTPLTAIKGWGETIVQLGDSDPETTSKGMLVIISESQRLSDMVEELLDFSRMQNGKMQLNKSKIDVLAELDDAVFTLKDRAVREGLEVIYNVPHLPLPMFGDAAKIRQVFVNLLDNAIKYNEHGGKVIILAEIRGDELVIFFTDTGCGISPENIPRVTAKFFRANMSVHGTGIGLAVADEIIKLHNGTMQINSVLGEGTTVTVTLPIDSADVTDTPNERKE